MLPDIGIKDYLILLIFFLVFFRIINSIKKKYLNGNPEVTKYFIPGILVKVIAAVAFSTIYLYYYGYGDTFYYYNMGSFFSNILKDNPFDFFKIYFTGTDSYFISKSYSYNFDYLYNHYPATVTVARISSLIGLFTFNNYLFTSIGFSLLSFTGLWKMFKMFSSMYHSFLKPFAYVILFIPSVAFWGSGIMKDSLSIGAIGWITYSIYNIFFLKRKIKSSLLILLVCFALIYTLKAYILICFIPATIIWISSIFYSKIRDRNVRLMFWIFLIFVLILMVYQSEYLLTLQKNQMQQLAATALSINTSVQGYEAGSSYKLSVSSSLSGLITVSPLAIVTTFFRPFFWEAKSIVMFISAAESFLVLFISLFVFLKTGIIKSTQIIFSNGVIFFCFFFALTFSIGTAITSENFGTLVRYKLPSILFYLIGLLVLYYKSEKPLPGFLKNKL